MPTVPAPTQEQMARYRATVRRQEQAARDALVRREGQAWSLARQAAALLREEFHVEAVVVFGSLVHRGCFTRWSDVISPLAASTRATPSGRWRWCGT